MVVLFSRFGYNEINIHTGMHIVDVLCVAVKASVVQHMSLTEMSHVTGPLLVCYPDYNIVSLLGHVARLCLYSY